MIYRGDTDILGAPNLAHIRHYGDIMRGRSRGKFRGPTRVESEDAAFIRPFAPNETAQAIRRARRPYEGGEATSGFVGVTREA